MKCAICGIEFDSDNTFKKTCSKECEFNYKSVQQREIYKRMSKPTKDSKTYREKISSAVFKVLSDMMLNGKPKKDVSRNDIESKIISLDVELSKCDSRFRKRGVTISIINYGYHIYDRNKYDILFKYIYNVKNK